VRLTACLEPCPALFVLPGGWQMTGVMTAELAQVVGVLQPGAVTGTWFNVMLTGVTNSLKVHTAVRCDNDDNAANDSATATMFLNWPDLQVTLQPSKVQVTEGDQVTYTLRVANESDVPVAGIWVTNSYPSCVTITNAGGGIIASRTNVYFSGLSLAARATTSLTVRVRADYLPAGVTSLVSTARCALPFGDPTPANNVARSETPLFGKDVTVSVTWVLSQNTGTYFARLALTNSSLQNIDSAWFEFKDRLVTNGSQVTVQSALCDTKKTGIVNLRYVSQTNALCARYVDLTTVITNALVKAYGSAVWSTGRGVDIGVSAATLAAYAAHNNIGSVNNPAERVLEMFDVDRFDPGTFVNLTSALCWKSGTINLPGDQDQDFKISPAEVAAAKAAWLAGTLSNVDYLFIAAASRGGGYVWDMELKRWLILP